MLGIRPRRKRAMYAVAQIESGGADVSIFDSENGLVAHASSQLPVEKRAEALHITGILRALEEAVQKAQKEALSKGAGRIETVYMIVHTPWSRSETLTATVTYQKEAKITAAAIAELAESALSHIKDLDPARIIESAIVRVSLNGYPTSQPEGKKAKSLEVSVLASDCDKRVGRGAAETIARHFPDTPMIWRSSARAFFTLQTDTSDLPGNYVAVVFGSVASEAFVVEEGLLAARVPVEIGFNELISRLSTSIPEASHALLDLAAQGLSTSETTGQLHGNFARAESELARSFAVAFEILLKRRHLPGELVLIAPRSLVPLLSHLFSRYDFQRFTHASQPFSIRHFARFKGSRATLYADDPSLAAAIALINTEHPGTVR